MAAHHPRRGQRKQTIMRKAGDAVEGLGRWFGVAGDQTDMEMTKRQYRETWKHSNASLGNRGNPQPGRLGKGEQFSMASIQFADSSDEEQEEFLEDRRTNVDQSHLSRDKSVAMAKYREIVAKDLKQHRKEDKPGWFHKPQPKGAQHLPMSSALGRKTLSKPKKKHKLRRNETVIALQLQALPTYTPYFINTMSFIQFVIVLIMCAHAYTEGDLATWQLSNGRETCSLTSEPLCPEAFNGTLITGMTKISESNMWLGPKRQYLLGLGAKFPPCMRKDTEITIALAQERLEQCGTPAPTGVIPNTCDAGINGYGCCHLTVGSRAGMTSEPECDALGGTWNQHDLCDEGDTNIVIVLRPCCIGFDSTCRMLTQDACVFFNGVRHSDKQLCSETMCLGDVCRMPKLNAIEQDPVLRNQPSDINQWWRFFLPIFLHSGGIHFCVNMLIQWFIGRQIETAAGALRTAIIYFVSGLGGNAVSGIFVPRQVDAGPSGAVYGLLGVIVVELFQSWQIIPKPFFELAKVLGITSLALVVGTFPYIDNFAHIAGFLFGVVSSIIFLPYITFGKWDHARKKTLLMLALPLLLVMGILAFVFFYQVQNTNFCSWCSSVNCVEWTPFVDCNVDLNNFADISGFI